MKRRWLVLAFLVALFSWPQQPLSRADRVLQLPERRYACTSFAVFADRPLYGMNFDYPDVELRFTLTRVGDRKVFVMEFTSTKAGRGP